MRTRVVAVGAALMTVLLAPAAGAATQPDFGERVRSWDVAADRLGISGSLWEPTQPAGLRVGGPWRVLAGGLTFANGVAQSGATTVRVRYTRGPRTLDVWEKWENTAWVRQPPRSSRRGLVRRVRLRMGLPGGHYVLPAWVYANCGKSRCAARDVLATGGQLVFTARAGSTMSEPSHASVVLTSRGLSYTELVDAAASMEQVAGSLAHGAGSAQMQAMCRQMAAGAMTAEAASEFALANGYVARVGTIDGQPQPVTMDYRPGRFTLSVTNGAVVSCTYE